MAAHQRQRDQAARVVGAVDVLADAHAPEDHARSAVAKVARHVAQRLGVDAADLGHLLGREALQVAFSASQFSVKPSMYCRS
jgi:hypothetical protein